MEVKMKARNSITAADKGWWLDSPTVLRVDMHGLYDANDDGMGDFRGVVEKLPFLCDAGFSGLRFQQVCNYGNDYQFAGLVHQSWFDTDNHYGTEEDFDAMIASCRACGMKLIVMAVPEYIGWDHPDYLAAAANPADPRRSWFLWKDDGTVVTCWERPGMNTSNADYVEMYIRYLNHWMDRGIAGFDVDDVVNWINLDANALKRLTNAVTCRGGFICPEASLLENETLQKGLFNAGSGRKRDKLYFEAEAILEGDAGHIRKGLTQRAELLKLGVFPYQEFGGKSHAFFKGCYGLEMFKLQAAFNAVIPDQLWVHACGLTFEDPVSSANKHTDPYNSEAHVNWPAIERQQANPASAWSHVKRMLQLRKRTPALGVGFIEEAKIGDDGAFAAVRTAHSSGQRALVVFNLCCKDKSVTVDLSGFGVKRLTNLANGQTLLPDGSRVKITLPLYGYAMFGID
jgi:hypothetical protein